MTFKSIKNNQKGLMLVELMVVLVLLGIILALSYMYFDYGVQAFERGERRSIAQTASRLTSDFIKTEIRFAKEITINPDVTIDDDGYISESGDYRYIYLDDNPDSPNTDSIVFQNEDGNKQVLADSQADDMPYSIRFDSNIPDDVVIFEIEADNNLYQLDTRIQALNIRLYRDRPQEGRLIDINNSGNDNGDYTIIEYKHPE